MHGCFIYFNLSRIGSLWRRCGPVIIRNHLFAFDHSLRRPGAAVNFAPQYQLIFPFAGWDLRADMLQEAETSMDVLSERVRCGDLLGVIFCGGRIVHRSLVQTRGVAGMEGDPMAFDLTERQAYVHYCQTSVVHRGRRLYPLMLTAILRWYSKQPGHQETLIACRQENGASIHGILKAGFYYSRSSLVVGLLAGRIRWRHWYIDRWMNREGCR